MENGGVHAGALGKFPKVRDEGVVVHCGFITKEMTTVDEDDIIPLVTFTLLILSELLPFVGQTDSNGVLHTIFRVIAKIVKSSRQHILGIHQPTAVQPTAMQT